MTSTLIFFLLVWLLPCSAPLPSDPLPIFGIFTTFKDRSVRQVIRTTWLRHPGFCRSFNASATCKYRFMFVAGKVHDNFTRLFDDEMRVHGDLFQLPCRENMDHGKTFVWFNFALQRFPLASWYGKLDSDVYMLPDAFHSEFSTFRNDIPAQFGIFVDYPYCGQHKHCPWGWFYMQGQFYAVSGPLLRAITSSELSREVVGPEDLEFGRMVTDYSRRSVRIVNHIIWVSGDFQGAQPRCMTKDLRHDNKTQRQVSFAYNHNTTLWVHYAKSASKLLALHRCFGTWDKLY